MPAGAHGLGHETGCDGGCRFQATSFFVTASVAVSTRSILHCLAPACPPAPAQEVMGTSGVDGVRTKTNHVMEVQATLGIEAARRTIM